MKTVLRINACVCFELVVILIGGICAALGQPSNGINSNQNAFTFAAELIRQGHFIADHKGGWSDDTNFRTVISKMFIDALCSRSKVGQRSMTMATSKTRQQN